MYVCIYIYIYIYAHHLYIYIVCVCIIHYVCVRESFLLEESVSRFVTYCIHYTWKFISNHRVILFSKQQRIKNKERGRDRRMHHEYDSLYWLFHESRNVGASKRDREQTNKGEKKSVEASIVMDLLSFFVYLEVRCSRDRFSVGEDRFNNLCHTHTHTHTHTHVSIGN